MSQLFAAAQIDTGRTYNGGVTNQSSLSSLVDLFFLIGASRGKNITTQFVQAFADNQELALRILQYARDIRGGMGERQIFRDCLLVLEDRYQVFPTLEEQNLCGALLYKVAEIGRWDDLLVFKTKLWKNAAFQLIEKALNDGNALCAKWMPRKGKVAQELRDFLGMSPKQYRKTLVNLTKVVETQMCNNEWTEINYSHVPSVAAKVYQKAFNRHDPEGYSAYREALVKKDPSQPEVKINASAIFPHDVITGMLRGDKDVAMAQWQALPNYLGESNERILPLVDVSASMGSMDYYRRGFSSNLAPIFIAISLGLYISERNKSIFKDSFLTFESTPKFVTVKGNLNERMTQMAQAPWGGSTDIQAAFRTLLQVARFNNLPESEMPTKILILSDMEFNSTWVNGRSVSAFKMMQKEYEAAGYKLPQIVFWNLSGRAGNSPVKMDTTGTAMVSGFSPAIIAPVLGGDEITPERVMLKAIMNPRYDLDFKVA